MRYNLSLTVKLNLMFFLIFIILFSVSLYETIKLDQTFMNRIYSEKGIAIGQALEANIQTRESFYDKNQLLITINKQIWLNPDILQINVNIYDKGELITLISNDPVNLYNLVDSKNMESYTNDKIISTFLKVNGEDRLRVIIPVHISGQVFGTYQIDFTLEQIKSDMKHKISMMFIIYGLFSLVFILLTNIVLNSMVSKPISELNKEMNRVSDGIFEKKARVYSNDEIGRLNSSFYKMSDELNKSKSVIESHQKDLEKQVEERTKQLQSRVKELEKFHNLTIGREQKMIELKKKIKELEKKDKPGNTKKKNIKEGNKENKKEEGDVI
jgi:methyl-accepting chemotaxis protein